MSATVLLPYCKLVTVVLVMSVCLCSRVLARVWWLRCVIGVGGLLLLLLLLLFLRKVVTLDTAGEEVLSLSDKFEQGQPAMKARHQALSIT